MTDWVIELLSYSIAVVLFCAWCALLIRIDKCYKKIGEQDHGT